MQTESAPRRRGRPRKIRPHFPGTVLHFASRPRLRIGDVVELCRDCLPSNRGKLAVITEFASDGWVLVRSISGPLDAIDLTTGIVTHENSIFGRLLPGNLYRRSRSLIPPGFKS